MKHFKLPWRTSLIWTGVVLVLVAVFTLYTRPEFLVNLADQLWACF